MGIEEELEGVRREFARTAKPELRSAVEKAIAELIASGQAVRAISAGELAPSFLLADETGRRHSSDELITRGSLVVIFLRGLWCGYCRVDLAAINDQAEAFRERGASIVAIVPHPDTATFSAPPLDLSFPVLLDQGGRTAEAYGLTWRLPRSLVGTGGPDEVAGGTSENGDADNLPIPARFVVGQDGVVAYADVDPNYTRRPDAAELIPILERLAEARKPRRGARAVDQRRASDSGIGPSSSRPEERHEPDPQ